jgi:predicted DNA-binding transcriptional regulator AlpA
MSATAPRRERAELPAELSSQHRLVGSDVFRAALGGLSRSAFHGYLAKGVLPAPDVKFGKHNRWRQSTVENAVEALAAARAGHDAALT